MITKRRFLKWLLSTSYLIGFSAGSALAKSLPSKAYIVPIGVRRLRVRMMGGGGGGGSVCQNATGATAGWSR